MCRNTFYVLLPVRLNAEPGPLGMGSGGFLEEVAG